MKEIRLQRARWKFDTSKQLGPEGGFGAVFEGESESGETVAVKRLKLTADQAAHRELQVAEELFDRSFENVLPVLDAGQDAQSDRYFLVMPKAEGSLQAFVDDEGPLEEKKAGEILLAVASGLREVPELVHRDLKPGNVLRHAGDWRIADFGIAKFVEESTSLRTVKQCLSPPYAAPEQWNLESAVSATDTYALGCIGHTLVTGSPPFDGPALADYQSQHLNEDPPTLQVAPRLRSLLSMMLRKAPDARPSLARVSTILESFLEDSDSANNDGQNSLAEAGAAVAERESEREAEKRRRARQRKKRSQLADSALTILWNQVEELFDRIQKTAPAAERTRRGKIVLGEGALEISEMKMNPIDEEAFENCGWDVVVGAIISAVQNDPEYIWSSSLWYAKRHENDEYRWREASYFAPSSNKRQYEPYFLDDPHEADLAHSNVMHTHTPAWGPSPVDDEDAEDFYDRWMDLFARASQGNLRHPTRLPLEQ